MVTESRLRRIEALAARLRSGKAQAEADAEAARYFSAMSKNDLDFFYRAALHSSWEGLSPEERERLAALLAPIDPGGEGLRLLQNPPPPTIPPGAPPAKAAELYHKMLREG